MELHTTGDVTLAGAFVVVAVQRKLQTREGQFFAHVRAAFFRLARHPFRELRLGCSDVGVVIA